MFLLLDAAVDRDIPRAIYQLESDPQCIALFYQGRHRKMLDAGPILVLIKETSPLLKWALASEKIFTSAILLSSMHTVEHVADSLIKHIDIISDDGERLLFRFYDAVVMSDMILSNSAPCLNTILREISSLALNYYDKNNQNVWGTFYRNNFDKITNDAIIYNDNYIYIFEGARVRREIHKHIVELNEYIKKSIIFDSVHDHFNCIYFDSKIFYSEKSKYISDDVYNMTLDRLKRYEKMYDISNFTYVLKCDFLFSLADENSKSAMHNVLMDKEQMIDDKINLCQRILEEQHG